MNEERTAQPTGGLLVLFLLLLLLLPLKLMYLPGPGPYGADANYFHQIARHVADGDGLRTSVSIYHEGMQALPGPTRVYPLWPLLLGATAAVTGLHRATQVLPTLFYFIDLLLLYLLARAVGSRLGSRTPHLLGINPAHAVVMIFAVNRLFFTATAHPYTEGLAFSLGFGALLALDRFDQAYERLWVVMSGALCGLAFLARSQMAILGVSIGTVLVWQSFRRGGWSRVALFVVSTIAVLLPWYAYVARHYPLEALNPFAGINPFFEYRATQEIAPFEAWVPAKTVGEWLVDRIPGILVAINPRHPMSYFSSFGAVVALLPIALLRLPASSERFQSNGRAMLSAMILSGILFQVTLLHFHATFFLPWLFGWRHGLPLILLLCPAVIMLMGDRIRYVRILATTVVVVTIVTGLVRMVELIGAPVPAPPSAADRQFVSWVDSQTEKPTILSPEAAALGMLSRGHYHWTLCTESPEQTKLMLKHLPIDYVLVYEHGLDCPFIAPLLDDMSPVRVFGHHDRLVLLEPKLEQNEQESAGDNVYP